MGRNSFGIDKQKLKYVPRYHATLTVAYEKNYC